MRRRSPSNSQMAALGFRKVASMRGGMMHWNDARLPIARTLATTPGHGAAIGAG